MSVQVRRRRETAAFLSTFVGAQGELLIDTTNNRVQVHDGATPGGFPAAKLADLPSSASPLAITAGGTGATTAAGALAALGVVGRTAITDASYTALATDRTIAFVALTAARSVTLPAVSTYPTGTQLIIVDESGACSASNSITLARAGTDTINGAASAVIALPYGFLALVGNGAGKWTVIDQSTTSLAQQAASGVVITGGAIDGTTLGNTVPGQATVTYAYFANQSSTADQGAYRMYGSSSGSFFFQTSNDAKTSSVNIFGVTRGTGTAVSNLAFYAPVVMSGTNSFTSNNISIGGGAINATPVGATTASTMRGTTVTATTSVNLPSYTVAALPAAGTAGRIVYCSNARMQTTTAGTLEASGAGTGGLVTDNGSAWKIAGTNITVTA